MGHHLPPHIQQQEQHGSHPAKADKHRPERHYGKMCHEESSTFMSWNCVFCVTYRFDFLCQSFLSLLISVSKIFPGIWKEENLTNPKSSFVLFFHFCETDIGLWSYGVMHRSVNSPWECCHKLCWCKLPPYRTWIHQQPQMPRSQDGQMPQHLWVHLQLPTFMPRNPWNNV